MTVAAGRALADGTAGPLSEREREVMALLAGGATLTAALATAVPAAAATSGSQTFKGAIVTSGVSGTRTVITTVVIAKGAFSGVGRIVEVENQPGDPDKVTRDDLVFARGSMHLVSTALGEPQPSVNPRSCAPYRCMGTACGVTCFSNADCAPGNSCVGGACQGGGTVTGRLLFRRFRASFIVNWLADFRLLSSLHSTGIATGAPGRARTP